MEIKSHRVHSTLTLTRVDSTGRRCAEHYANRMRSTNSSGYTLILEKVLKFISSYFSRNEERKASGNTLERLEDTLISGLMRFVELLCVTWK